VKGVVWSTALLLDMREKKESLPSVHATAFAGVQLGQWNVGSWMIL
jgi:hypothetical protein